jgi:hypothetical protein
MIVVVQDIHEHILHTACHFQGHMSQCKADHFDENDVTYCCEKTPSIY